MTDRPEPNQGSTDKPTSFMASRAANAVRYSMMNIFIICGIVTMAIGGGILWFGLLMTFALIGFMEEFVGDAGENEEMPPVWYMNLMLWLTLPLLLILTAVCVNTTGSGNDYVDMFVSFFGFDPVNARAITDDNASTGGLTSLGMYFGLGGINVAHELVHRTNSKFSLITGRWLLALSWDTGFSIEHVYGHHKNVGTLLDPATARRGEYIWVFVFRSAWGQLKSAYAFEKARLKRRNIPNLPWNSRFWRGQMMTLCVIGMFYLLAGPEGVAMSLYAAAIGKIYLEMVNYVEHYGLVRIPGTRVEPRHSWDSHRRLSTGMTYNLPLHSFHHKYATRPFWELQQTHGEALVLPGGYMPMIFASMIPRVWRHFSEPLLLDWDTRLASEDERAYLKSIGQLRG